MRHPLLVPPLSVIRALAALGLVLLLAACGSSGSSDTTSAPRTNREMNFNSQATGGAPNLYEEDGIRLTATAPGPSRLFNLGTAPEFVGYAFNTSNAVSFDLELVSGAPFDLLSLDTFSQTSVNVTVEGTYAAGGTVSEDFMTPSSDFATWAPTMDFTGLASVRFSIGPGAGVTFIDNILLLD